MPCPLATNAAPIQTLLVLQVRDVAVYRLIAAGTLEELVYTRQLYKQQQAAVALEGAEESRYFQGAPAAPAREIAPQGL